MKITKQTLIEFYEWAKKNEWELDHRNQRILTTQELCEIFLEGKTRELKRKIYPFIDK